MEIYVTISVLVMLYALFNAIDGLLKKSYILVAYSMFGFFMFLLALIRVIAKEKGITIIPSKVLKRIVIIIIILSATIIFIIQLIQVMQGKVELVTKSV